MKEELEILEKYIKKKNLKYNEFNELIGNYFVREYEELDDNYYLIKIVRPNSSKGEVYTDYIKIIN